MKRFASLIIAGWLGLAASTGAQSIPPVPTTQLLAEARVLAQLYGDRIWPGMRGTPFTVLILYPQHDVLSCAVHASADFSPLPKQKGSDCRQWIRMAGSLPRSMQASLFLPGIPGPVMVSGTPLETSTTPGSWLLTALHEHFHQMQMSRPGYQQGTQKLGLSDGDDTGMWMLDYAFAYDNARADTLMRNMAHDLAKILRETNTAKRRQLALAYAKARPARMAQLSVNDRKYMELQLWQEGVARYTELRFANYAAAAQDQGWRGSVDYAALELNLRDNLMHQLQTADLSRDRRDIFYPLGAAESLVLDMINPHWHERYFRSDYSMAPLFAGAIKPAAF